VDKVLKYKIILFTSILIITGILFFIAVQQQGESDDTNSLLVYNPGRVIQILEDNTMFPHIDNPDATGTMKYLRQGTVLFEIEILRGEFKGEIFEAHYHMNSPSHIDFEVGDHVTVRIFEFNGEVLLTEVRYPSRIGHIVAMIAFFGIFLCAIGGKRGFVSLISLIFTIVCVIFILIPLIVAGFPVISVTLLILTLFTITTITLLAGLTPKALSSICGTLSGVLTASVFALVAGQMLHISGYNLGNYRAIIHLSGGARLGGLFISSVLVAAIGAIMDSTMSVASAMEEVLSANPEITEKKLFKAGFNVSRDVIGTMSSTLILAYIGGSLAMMIFMQASNVTFNQFINSDMIAIEIIMGIAGSMGIILSAPLTALIGTKLMTLKRNKLSKVEEQNDEFITN